MGTNWGDSIIKDMSGIPLTYHTNIKFYTQYTHPTLICRGTDARTNGRTENIYSIFSDKLLLLGEHVFARLWFCEDIHHSSILKLAIEKAIQNSTNANLSSELFQDDSNYQKNHFVGFVSSHKKGKLLTSFHIHSLLSSILICRRTQL